MPNQQSKNCRGLNGPQSRPYVSVHYGWKYSQKKTLTVKWIWMLIQERQPVISAGIGRGWESLRRAIYSNLWASQTWKWATKELRITGESRHMGLKAHHCFNASEIIDHPFPKYGQSMKLPRFNLGFWIRGRPLKWLSSPREEKLCFECACWHPLLWPFKWLLLSQHRMAKHSELAEPSAPPAPSSPSPQRRHTKRSLACLFTICRGNPQRWIIEPFDLDAAQRVAPGYSEAWGGGSLSRGSDAHGGDLKALQSSPPFLCSCRSLSGRHHRHLLRLGLAGRPTNSRSLALVELVFLFRGSCLVSLSRYLVVRPQPFLQIAREWSMARLFVAAREYTERDIKKKEARRKVKPSRRRCWIKAAWCYLAALAGASPRAVRGVSREDRGWETSPIRYHIPILFISLWTDEEETYDLLFMIKCGDGYTT